MNPLKAAKYLIAILYMVCSFFNVHGIETSKFGTLPEHFAMEFQISDTIVYYDTMVVYDTVYTVEVVYDTILYFDTTYIYEAPELSRKRAWVRNEFAFPNHYKMQASKPLSLKTNKLKGFELEGYFERFNHYINFSGGGELSEVSQESLRANPGTAFGLNLNYKVNTGSYLQTGLAVSHFNETIDLNYDYQTDSILKTEYLDTIITTVKDSVWIYNIDSLSGSWHPYEYVSSHEETIVLYDTLQKKHELKKLKESSWTYMEVPVLGAYRVRHGLLSMDIKGGLIAGFLAVHHKYEIYPEDNLFAVRKVNQSELVRLNLDLYVSANMAFQFMEQWSLYVEPGFRLPVYNYSSQSLNPVSFRYGLRLGFRYSF